MRETELNSNHQDLDKMSTLELLAAINQEDQSVPIAVDKASNQIEALINAAYTKMKEGGRLFYLGAGTSGRLGIVDASECPPTFGVDHGVVVGLIAGGDNAIRKAVENAEDNPLGGWEDLLQNHITDKDFVIGIAASGTTPYVIGALQKCNEQNILTGCVVCTSQSPVAKNAAYPIEVITGPEFVTGSTRMKAGTAQKLVLNMISTSLMIKLGHVKGNKMVDMQLSNAKLVERGTRMIQEEINISKEQAKSLLLQEGSVRKAVAHYKANQ